MRRDLRGIVTASLAAIFMTACAHRPRTDESTPPPHPSPNPAAYRVGPELLHNDFKDLTDFHLEREAGGSFIAHDGMLEIDVPKGATAWLKEPLSGPVLIEYEARMVRAEPPGPNDRVSDLNCFWMASDPRNAQNFFDVPQRTGAFATYNQLKTYYVGQGGNGNTTTRFRRYVGDVDNRPLLPEHDLSGREDLLTPNVWQKITLVACGELIEYYRDGKRVFTLRDTAPYTSGYFGIRTTFSHLQVRGLRVWRLVETK